AALKSSLRWIGSDTGSTPAVWATTSVALHVGITWPIGHQTTRFDQLPAGMHPRQAVSGGKLHDQGAVVQEKPLGQHQQRARPLPDDRRECIVDLFQSAHPQ